MLVRLSANWRSGGRQVLLAMIQLLRSAFAVIGKSAVLRARYNRVDCLERYADAFSGLRTRYLLLETAGGYSL